MKRFAREKYFFSKNIFKFSVNQENILIDKIAWDIVKNTSDGASHSVNVERGA
jgi:hypothetical protein